MRRFDGKKEVPSFTSDTSMTPRPDPEMVERVAKALWSIDRYGWQNSGDFGCPETFADHDTNGQANYRSMAAGAIEASGLLSLQRERDELTEALEYIVRLDGKRPDGFTDWQRCVDRIQEVARAALTHVENEGREG